jgi:hypothetical protein
MKSYPRRLDLIIQKMYSENIDILLIQEINTNLAHPTVKKELHQIKNRYPNLQCVWAQIPDVTHQINQPGGTGIIVKPPIAHHISHCHIDSMGRWAGVTIRLRHSEIISIISTY